jgi:hypothetical protein
MTLDDEGNCADCGRHESEHRFPDGNWMWCWEHAPVPGFINTPFEIADQAQFKSYAHDGLDIWEWKQAILGDVMWETHQKIYVNGSYPVKWLDQL